MGIMIMEVCTYNVFMLNRVINLPYPRDDMEVKEKNFMYSYPEQGLSRDGAPLSALDNFFLRSFCIRSIIAIVSSRFRRGGENSTVICFIMVCILLLLLLLLAHTNQ